MVNCFCLLSGEIIDENLLCCGLVMLTVKY